MSSRRVPVAISAAMRLEKYPDKVLNLDLSNLQWTAHGLEGIAPLRPVMLDLIEIARTVHEFDRHQPKRVSAVRLRRVEVDMSLRDPGRWTKSALEALESLLRIQGNTEWKFTFSQRGNSRTQADTVLGAKSHNASSSAKRPKAVVLFSGGLDSTSGLATIRNQADEYQLVSYYWGNLSQQEAIAAELGFNRLAQIGSVWKTAKRNSASGGLFWYRSFLFLSLAAAVADALGSPSILQFENGPLALSVAPAGIYRITRHAHPAVHEQMEILLKLLSGRAISVSNPFLKRTKAEAVSDLRKALDDRAFRQLVRQTESCWYLKSQVIVAGPKRKKNGQACGACVPCLVRRAALDKGDDIGAGVDFGNSRDRLARDQVIRVHFDSYSEFTKRLLSRGYTLHDFLAEIPAPTRRILADGIRIDAMEALDLYRRFAKQWTRAFS